MARTRAGGSGGNAGLFEPALKWMRKKVQSSRRHHHVFHGEVRGSPPRGPVGSGWHHRFMGQDPPDRRVVRVTRRSVDGTYAADVEMRGGPTGAWYPKPAGSSFFPDNWTPQRVDRAINDAFDSGSTIPGTGGRRWRGQADGLLIEGSYHRNGRTWNSGWPIVS
ncbi:EndoU nuclease [Asanoa hainanensis]|uniref:EndoU nuclease n=1 Tax=Asanoa hainanensis TaxID=560556 RepID=A0A239IJA3_9ACTN|nr:EndoU domain-containing protein [Asanoa hainanensis]SNS93318.1 EndoU nuclease [Asanoa hainanensis]